MEGMAQGFSKATFFPLFQPYHSVHGLMNYIDTKAKCRHLTKIDL
jgi:hypothetical protein